MSQSQHNNQNSGFDINGTESMIDFNQFLNQYNMGSSELPIQAQQCYAQYSQAYFPPPSTASSTIFPAVDNYFPAVENSTLLPTAAEFFPSWQDPNASVSGVQSTSCLEMNGVYDGGHLQDVIPAMEQSNLNTTRGRKHQEKTTDRGQNSGPSWKKSNTGGRGNFRYTNKREGNGNGNNSSGDSRNHQQYNSQQQEYDHWDEHAAARGNYEKNNWKNDDRYHQQDSRNNGDRHHQHDSRNNGDRHHQQDSRNNGDRHNQQDSRSNGDRHHQQDSRNNSDRHNQQDSRNNSDRHHQQDSRNNGDRHHQQDSRNNSDRHHQHDSRNSGGYSKRDSRSSNGNNWRSNQQEQHEQQSQPPPRRSHKIEIKDKFDENVSQRDKLAHEIDVGKLECLVCCERIKPFQQTWSCINCYHILHLGCTTKWANSSKSDDGWRCPACQNITKSVPRDYYCFCGKTKNPHFNRNDLAHSCGELCERKDTCVHPCTQLCHPGPCPACQATVTRYCGCGKTSRIMQCNQKDEIKCSEICSKVLNCGVHRCQELCHYSECTNCSEKVNHKCHCGKDQREVFCDKINLENLTYSCDKVCDLELTCGNHRCKEICHVGDCGICESSPNVITSCPCGKLPIVEGQRKSCIDPIPLCTNVCKRQLKCGPPSAPHVCTNRCHKGECSPCNKETAVKCRCGHMDQMIKCRELSTRADDARCKKRCTKKRNCGKHKCNQECCIDIDHICPVPCNYSLSCGKHKCDQTCHKGRCLACYRSSFEELHCECGANVIYPPVPCGTKRPLCDQPCSRQHPCHHPVQHNCHSAQTCPPCMILTTKSCHGKHEQRKTIPCSQTDFSCGMPCNKPLACGRHKCIKTCHSGPCMAEAEICKQNCTKLRASCGHKCNAPCHEADCPTDIPCKEMVEVTCQCSNRKQNRTCHDFASDYRRIATASLASSMQEMQRGHSIELSDILGPVKINNTKTLECNEDCRLIERNRRLAIGLQIRNPDVSSKLQPKYSDLLKTWAKKDPHFMQNIHDKLTELVKLSKDSKQRSRSHSFPTMNREKRQIVHEMCGMFGVESVAYDAEPNRNVVATAHKDKSWLPSLSITELMQREGGQRRIPVPVNAWGLKK